MTPAEQAALEAIYARPRYEAAKDTSGAALEALRARFAQWLRELFETQGAAVFSNWTRVVVLAIGVGLAITLVWRWVLRRRAAAGSSTRSLAAAAPRVALDDPRAHLSRARALLDSEPRAALRQGLLATLSALERGRLARLGRATTNREVAEALPQRGASSELTAQVRSLTGFYDRTYYAGSEVSAADAHRFLGEVEVVVGALESRA